MGFQIFLVVFAIFAIIRTFRQHLASKVSSYWLLVWTVIWACVIVVALVPTSTNVLANVVGIGRGADLIVYTGLVILFFTTYRLLVIIEQQRKEITNLTRAVASAGAHKPEPNKK